MASFSSASPLIHLLRPGYGHSWRLQQSYLPCPHSFIHQIGDPSTLTNFRTTVHLRYGRRRLPWLCSAAPSPAPGPPSSDDQTAGLQVVLSRVRDRVRIFFAVLFWMSLFFWGSVWDGKDSSRKKKGPWFRK